METVLPYGTFLQTLEYSTLNLFVPTCEFFLNGTNELEVLEGINDEQVLSFLIPNKDGKLSEKLIGTLINMIVTSRIVQLVLFSQ